MKKNKGFTLIELLAVIVILAVIAVISVPLITGVIEKAQASAYKESLRGIFEATDLYVASANFNGFPNDGINITDSNIQMKNKSFTSGKIIKNAEGKLELEKVSNGSYCGSGPIDNLVIIEGSCDSLDETAPTDVILTSNLITSNSVTIVASATDLESGISGYQFSKDNGVTWTNKQTSNIYTFMGLTNNTSYTFKVKVYNNNLLSTISNEISETTTNVEVPTYAINPTGWTKSAVVTIAYPERESGYVYEYSLDEGLSWEEVASPDITKDITFNENGSVIARVSDGVNEIVGTTYQVTNIDTVAPIITVNPATVTIILGNNYSGSGVTATDNMLGDITSNIVTTGTVDTNTLGTYTLTYNVSDEAGNAAIEVTRTVIVMQNIYTFNYTGNVQSWTVPIDGTYLIETWGAEGNHGGSSGYSSTGRGGYAKGNIQLNAGTVLHIYVGSGGAADVNGGWNGGGQSGTYGGVNGSGGGGATDIRLVNGNWNDINSLRSRIMVAGGGGGAGSADISIGHAGGLTGGNSRATSYLSYGGNGATQTAGGASPSNYSGISGLTAGSFGVGGNGNRSTSNGWGAGGGGGYYGGSGGSGAGSGHWGGGGGNSFISGHTGCNAINTTGSHTGQPNHYSGYVFTSTEMQSAVRSGNGQAKITFVSQ